VALVLVLACGGKPDANGRGSGAPLVVEHAGSGSAAAPAKRASSASAGSGAGSADDAERVAQAAYRAAMRAGRKATDAKHYDEAIDAFNAALKVRPNDARAISERGFAYLLDGSLLGAEEDLDRAAGLTKDKKLLSSIWFNRGLVEDKRHEDENAIVDFYIANQLHPTAAAQAKLDGKTVCPVHVDRVVSRGSDEFERRSDPVDAPSWVALFPLLPDVVVVDGSAPKNDAAARDALRADKTLPTIAATGEAGQGRADFLVVRHDAGLRAYPLGFDDGGRCPGYTAFEIVKVAGTVVLVHGTVLAEGGMTDMCLSGSGELAECTGASGEEPHGEACFSADPRVYDIAIDTATDHRLVITRPKPAEDTKATAVNIALSGSGVAVSGLTCNLTLDLP
jgi:hypothetical protein